MWTMKGGLKQTNIEPQLSLVRCAVNKERKCLVWETSEVNAQGLYKAL